MDNMHTIRISEAKYCNKCKGNKLVYLARDIISSGASQIYWFCHDHGGAIDSPRKSLPHDWIETQRIDLDKIPVINNYSELVQCAVCGEMGAELHHWAPRHLFGDDAENWPKSYLCIKHHLIWHGLVTPKMCEK